MRRQAYLGVQRGIATMALVWQGAWMLADPSLREDATDAGVGLLFAGAFLAWIAIAVAMLLRAPVRITTMLAAVDVALLILVTTDLLLIEPAEKSSSALSMCLLSVGVTGLLLPLRAALPLSAFVIVVEVVSIVADDLDGAAGVSWLDLLAPAYAIAVGVAVIAGRHFALAAARRSDEAADALVALESRTRSLRAVEGELLATERLLHETALNTLTAIGRGGDLDPASVRARCAESARAIEGMAAAAPPPGGADPLGQLSSALLVVQASGCRVDTTAVEEGALEGVPDDVARTVIGGLREGLLNAARHSAATAVVLTLRARDGAVEATVRDDGRGFDPERRNAGFGIAVAIEESMRLVGGTGVVTSQPGAGTAVEMTWTPARESPALPSGANGVALPILIGFLGFGLLSMLATVSSADRPLLDVLAFAVALGVARLALPWGLPGTLPAWRVLAVSLAAPAVYLLQERAFDGVPATSWADWSAEVMVGILLTLACVGPWWTLAPALASWLITMGDPIAELTQPGTAVIVGGALFARSVRRSHRAHVDAIVRRVNEEAAAAVSVEAVRAIQRRYGLLQASGAAGLLRAIADGRVDPLDPGVREECRDEERFLRSVMRLDPELPLHELAGDLLVTARRRGVPLEIDLASDAASAASDVGAMRVACEAAVATAATGDVLRLSARREGGVVVVRLVGTLTGPIEAVPGVSIDLEADGSAVLEASLG